MDVDEQHPGGKQRREQDVEVKRASVETVKQRCEGDGADCDEGDKECAVSVVKAVTRLKIGVKVADVERARVEQAIGGIDHPDGEKHGCGFGPRKVEVRTACDEDGPESRDGRGVEG